MPDDELNNGGEPEINAVAVNLADIVGDEEPDDDPAVEEDAAEPEAAEEESGGGLDNIMDDIFAEEQDEDDRLKAFGDLEHLTMIEVSSEVEAVLEELRIRQGVNE